jgi:hypothetical protein
MITLRESQRLNLKTLGRMFPAKCIHKRDNTIRLRIVEINTADDGQLER